MGECVGESGVPGRALVTVSRPLPCIPAPCLSYCARSWDTQDPTWPLNGAFVFSCLNCPFPLPSVFRRLRKGYHVTNPACRIGWGKGAAREGPPITHSGYPESLLLPFR